MKPELKETPIQDTNGVVTGTLHCAAASMESLDLSSSKVINLLLNKSEANSISSLHILKMKETEHDEAKLFLGEDMSKTFFNISTWVGCS